MVSVLLFEFADGAKRPPPKGVLPHGVKQNAHLCLFVFVHFEKKNKINRECNIRIVDSAI